MQPHHGLPRWIQPFGRDVQCFVNRQWTCRDPLSEVFAVDELHHQRTVLAAGAVREEIDAVDLPDVGMVQRRQRSRFALDMGEPVGIRCQRSRKHLQRDNAP